MNSSIFYRFKSQKDFSKITFDGSQMGLTVFDLKREIIQTEKLGSVAETFDLRISSADTGDEYADDAENIPRGTSILAQRKPPARGAGKGSAARYITGNAIQIQARQEFKKSNPATNKSSTAVDAPPVPVPGSSEDEAIRAMLSASSHQWQETQDQMALSRPVFRSSGKGQPSGPVPDRPLPQGYICYRCGQKGHWIQACPTNGDDAFESRKRIKRTTGIPRSQLMKVEANDEDGNVMINAEGESVMFVPDSASWNTYQQNSKGSNHNEATDIAEFACKICQKLMQNPTITPCCVNRYCEDCIQTALLESDFICPTCSTKDVLLDQLKPDEELQGRIKDHKASLVQEAPTAEPDNASQTENVSGATEQTLDDLMMAFPVMPGLPPFPMPGLPMFPFMPAMSGLPILPPMPPMNAMTHLPPSNHKKTDNHGSKRPHRETH